MTSRTCSVVRRFLEAVQGPEGRARADRGRCRRSRATTTPSPPWLCRPAPPQLRVQLRAGRGLFAGRLEAGAPPLERAATLVPQTMGDESALAELAVAQEGATGAAIESSMPCRGVAHRDGGGAKADAARARRTTARAGRRRRVLRSIRSTRRARRAGPAALAAGHPGGISALELGRRSSGRRRPHIPTLPRRTRAGGPTGAEACDPGARDCTPFRAGAGAAAAGSGRAMSRTRTSVGPRGGGAGAGALAASPARVVAAAGRWPRLPVRRLRSARPGSRRGPSGRWACAGASPRRVQLTTPTGSAPGTGATRGPSTGRRPSRTFRAAYTR